MLADTHGFLDSTEQFLNQCDLSSYSSPQHVHGPHQKQQNNFIHTTASKIPRQQPALNAVYSNRDRLLLEALLNKLGQEKLLQSQQSESPELCASPSSPWGTPSTTQAVSSASTAFQQTHYPQQSVHQTHQANQKAYKKIHQQIIAQKFQQLKASNMSPFPNSSNNVVSHPSASSSPMTTELSAALQTQILQQQHRKLQQQQLEEQSGFPLMSSDRLTPDRGTYGKSGTGELTAQQNQQELYAATMVAQQQNAAQFLGKYQNCVPFYYHYLGDLL